mgnify:CR=1 FL=1
MLLNKWVTFEELKILTGLNDIILDKLILLGMPFKSFPRPVVKQELNSFGNLSRRHSNKLFEFNEVSKWIINNLIFSNIKISEDVKDF